MIPSSMRNKYKNIKTEYNGQLYDSKLEANIAGELWLLQKAGIVSEVERQKVFELLPKPNRITYRADFFVFFTNGTQEVWEAKGYWTPTAKLKIKLLKHFYPELKVIIRS